MKRTLTTKTTAVAGLAALALFGAACSDDADDGVNPGQEQEVDTDIGEGDEVGGEGEGDDTDTDVGEGEEVGGEDDATTTTG